MTFDDFGFHKTLEDALYYMHFDKPTPVQERAIPAILDGRDVIATAQTGTGKTASFVLPVLHDIVINSPHHIHSLIIVPTRELAMQIDQAIQGFSYYTNASSIAIYGGGSGEDFSQQRNAIKNGKVALWLGLEGGEPIEDSLDLLEIFYNLGVRLLCILRFHNMFHSSLDFQV